jgi:murein DD-endopeptidase MepM/ murein hydrolase activator NlpD
VEEVRSFELANRDQVRQTPSISPLNSKDFVLTSPYGTRTSPFTREVDFHAGIDLAAPIGTPILAPSDGIVAFAGRYPLNQSVGWWRYGNLVAIRHGERFITLFGHCNEVNVRGGDRVKQGDVIATVGDTGWSTNPHLHYEIRRLDEADATFKPVDPRIYILDHRWSDQERLLIRARRAPDAQDFEPLPRTLRR